MIFIVVNLLGSVFFLISITANSQGNTVPTPKLPEWEQIATRIFEHGELAVRGNVPVPEVLARLDRVVDGLLEKRRWMLAQREAP